MSTSKKRKYHSEVRGAQAQETKSRILSAAKKLFESRGFDKVTIDAIALAADVSTPTVYSLFQSKRGVLRALMDEALPTKKRLALVEKGKIEKSPVKRMHITAALSRQMYDAEKNQIDLLRSTSGLDPEFKKLEVEREERRYTRQAEFMQTLAKEGALAKGLTLAQAKDILWAFTGRDFYRMLVIERGWSSNRYEKWLAQLLTETLLAKSS